MIISRALCLKGEGIHAHLLHHCHQSVAAGGGEVFLQSHLLDEVEVGGKNVVRRLPREHAQQQGDDTFHDDGIAVGSKCHSSAFSCLGVNPHAALAALYQLFRSFKVLIERFKSVAKVYDIGIAVHPVVETAKFLNNLVLNLINCSHFLNNSLKL